jgi:hypothetical protein
MVRKTTLIVLLLAIFTTLPRTRVHAGEKPVLGLGGSGGATLADAAGDFFVPKAQGMGTLSASLEAPIFDILALGLGLQFHAITSSSLSGGWGYRSHWGGALRVSLGYRPADAVERWLTMGITGGVSLNFDLYTWTTLFFYYPGVFLEPYLELRSLKAPRHSLAFILPLDWYFRRDLEFFGSIGIGVVWRYILQ